MVMVEGGRLFWVDSEGIIGSGPTYGEHSYNGLPVDGRVFHTLKEVHDALFPNRPVEEFEGEMTDEKIKQLVEVLKKEGRIDQQSDSA